MSLITVHEEVKRFLRNSEPMVMCISGKWGVGKTYTWNMYLREAIKNKEIGLLRYSYASLFGKNTINDIKATMVESIISTTPLAKELSEEYVERFVKKSSFAFVKWMSNIFRHSQYFGQYLGGYEHLAFLGVRNQIVCIDDLERMGKDLTTIEILGLITFLKEQRKCKVVILLNREELDGSNKDDFDSQLEKVVDIMLHFQPTPIEAADIALPNRDEVTEVVHKSCVQLGITNIRVIKKIERQCIRLQEILYKKYPELMTTSIQSAVIFGWSTHQPKEAPSLDFLKKFNRVSYSLKDKIPEEDKKYCAILEAYDYSHTDEFDLSIMEGMRLGYFDVLMLEKEAKKALDKLIQSTQNNSFNKAWDLYHGSFRNNEDEVMNMMYKSTKDSLDILSPLNLHSAVTLLKEFGSEKQAQELIKLYVEKRSTEKEIFNLDQHSVFGEITDPDMIEAFTNARNSFVDSRNPADILESISKNSGWNHEDIELIERLSEDDFYKLFKATEGIKLHHIVRASTRWATDKDPRFKLISAEAIKALVKIGKESKINLRRVRRDGITIEEQI